MLQFVKKAITGPLSDKEPLFPLYKNVVLKVRRTLLKESISLDPSLIKSQATISVAKSFVKPGQPWFWFTTKAMKLCLLPFSNTTFPVWERKANSEFSIRHLDWERGIPEICRCQAEVNLCLTRCKQGAPLSGRTDTCLHWQPILRLVAPNWHSRGVDKMVN